MTLSVAALMPARNAAGLLPKSLPPLLRCDLVISEVLVYDDASEDDTASVAARLGAKVYGHEGSPVGPGVGRNRLAAETQCDLLLFVDSDVVVAVGAVARLAAAFDDPDVVAAFGSYDDSPAAPGIASRYVNLRHHFVHQSGSNEASTFWAGLGMARRTSFVSVSGFSSGYDKPSIEDIELGSRLRTLGRIRLVREAQGTHLKRWSLLQLWHTDIFRRAIPWANLISSGRSSGAGLNGSTHEQVAATLANLSLMSTLLGFAYPLAFLAGMVAFTVYSWHNRQFFSLLRIRMPRGHWLLASILHLLYHVYASQILGIAIVKRRLRGGGIRQ